MNLIINEIVKMDYDNKIDIIFGHFNDNIGNINLKNKQFKHIKDFLDNKYKTNEIIENHKYFYNNLKMVIKNNEKKYYELSNQVLPVINDNILCIIKKKNEINELEFPNISEYNNTTHNIINTYNYKNKLFFQLITENKNIKKFKIKINYSKDHFKNNIAELTDLWDNIKNIF